MTIKLPDKTYQLGGPLPPIPQKVVSWPWGGTPHLTQWSIDQLQHPLGTLIYDVVDGYPVLAQIQTHYSYGAHPDWPDKAHKGTSVFVPVNIDSVTGKVSPMRDVPDGWTDAGFGVDPLSLLAQGTEFALTPSRWSRPFTSAVIAGGIAATFGASLLLTGAVTAGTYLLVKEILS
jgi:hypothetical protein